MDTDFQIKLSAVVDLSSIDQQIQKHFDSKKYKIQVETSGVGASATGAVSGKDDVSRITKVSNAARDFQTKLQNLYETSKISEGQFGSFRERLEEIRLEFDKTEDINKYSKSLNALKNDVSEASTIFQRNAQAMADNTAAAGRQAKRINQVENQYKSFKQSLSNAYTQGQLTEQQFESMNMQLEKNHQKYNDAVSGITDFAAEETHAIEATTQWNNALKDQRNELSGMKANFQSHSQDLDKIIGKYLKWYAIATGVSLVINSIKSIFTNVKQLDAAMTELNKVTDVSEEALNGVKKQAFEIAKGLGRTGEEVIQATTEFARMGYTINESLDLAKVAVMMTNVAEGITDTGEAAEKLISILKGLGIGSEYAMSLLDRLNNVANKNAISFDKLADMLQSSAATMNILGNNLDETIALLTAGFEVLQDEKVANGLKTIGLRIAGLNEDLEEEAGLANDVSRALERYAGISVWDEETGALKSTFQILSEISEKWDEIGQRAGYQESLLNKLAGKRQSDVAGSIIKNFDAIQKVMKDLEESEGSAARENEVYMNSIEGHINAFKGAFQELADKTINSDFIKWIVDLGTRIVSFINNVGGLVPVLTTILSLIIAIKGQAIAKAIIGMITSLKTMIAGLYSAATAANVLQSAFGWIGLIGAAIGGIVMLIKGLSSAAQESASKVEQSYKNIAETYKEAKKQVSDFETQLSKLISKIKGLISLEESYDDKMSLAERVSELKKENEQVERQKKLQEKILSVQKAQLELERARQKQVRVFRVGRGFVYQSDESEVQSAQEKLAQSLNELAEYKYELTLERAEAFIEDFSKLAEQDKSKFLEGWKFLFDSYGDLLDTEFSSFITKAQEYVTEFKETFADIEAETAELATKSALEQRISELELERMEYTEGSDKYKDISERIANLQEAYNKIVDTSYKSTISEDSQDSLSAGEALAELGGKIVNRAGEMIRDASIVGAFTNDKGQFDVGEVVKSALIPGYAFVKGIGRLFGWFAGGTKSAPGGLSIVGEEGPELVDLPRGSRVYTASETKNMLSGVTNSGGGSTLAFYGDLSFPNVRTENDAEGFINGLMQIGNNGKPQFI